MVIKMPELEIWKYTLTKIYKNPVEMPIDSKILCLKTQYGKPTLWALVNPENQLEKRMFILKETGSLFKYTNYTYIGTVLSKDETYVLHCFEILWLHELQKEE
jgi:hypothetical protein